MKLAGVLVSLLLAMPAAAKSVDYAPQPGAMVPLATGLRDEEGRLTTLARLAGGRPAIIVLDYLRCPNVCGLTLSGLAEAAAAARLTVADATVVAISIDPREMPAQARAVRADYARRFPATAPWRFVTGREADVRRIADAVGFRYRWEPRLDQYLHSVGVVVLAADGRISGYLLGVNPSAAEISRAVVAARSGIVATPPSLIRLICFGGEPPNSRSGIIMATLRLGTIALLLAAGAWLLITWRRGKA